MECTSCGGPLSPGQRFCTSCGAMVAEPDSAQPADETPGTGTGGLDWAPAGGSAASGPTEEYPAWAGGGAEPAPDTSQILPWDSPEPYVPPPAESSGWAAPEAAAAWPAATGPYSPGYPDGSPVSGTGDWPDSPTTYVAVPPPEPPVQQKSDRRMPLATVVLLALGLAVAVAIGVAIGIWQTGGDGSTAIADAPGSTSNDGDDEPVNGSDPGVAPTGTVDPSPTPSEPPAPVTPTTVVPPTPTLSASPVRTPYWTVIIASMDEAHGGLGASQGFAAQLQAAGYTADIFQSAAHTSLRAGYWVTATGRLTDSEAASALSSQVKASGFEIAYPACVGTQAQCPPRVTIAP